MARSLEARLARLDARLRDRSEYERIVAMIDDMLTDDDRAAGITREALLDEARKVYALSDAQLRSYAEASCGRLLTTAEIRELTRLKALYRRVL